MTTHLCNIVKDFLSLSLCPVLLQFPARSFRRSIMFTFLETDGPLLARSAARALTRTVLLAGLTLPLVLYTQSQMTTDAAPTVLQPTITPGPGVSRLLTDALAGMRYGLSPGDLERYRRAFAAADTSDWQAMKTIVLQLEDRRLVGHVLAARYLSPSTNVPFSDLREWMDLYGDLPEADDVYRLALSREAKGDSTLPYPRSVQTSGNEALDPRQPHFVRDRTRRPAIGLFPASSRVTTKARWERRCAP